MRFICFSSKMDVGGWAENAKTDVTNDRESVKQVETGMSLSLLYPS